MVLFIRLYKMVVTFGLLMKSYVVIIQMKGIEQHLPVVLFFMLYKLFVAFESVDEILKCDHSNESY